MSKAYDVFAKAMGETKSNSQYEALLDATQTAVTEAFGPGAAFSVDPSFVGNGYVARVWNRAGYLALSDETPRPNRVQAVRALRRLIQQRMRQS